MKCWLTRSRNCHARCVQLNELWRACSILACVCVTCLTRTHCITFGESFARYLAVTKRLLTFRSIVDIHTPLSSVGA